MAVLSLPDVTGHGKSGFGLTITVTNIWAQLLTPGWDVRIDGSGTVKRVHRAAWFGIGYDGGGYPNDVVTFGKWLDFNVEYILRTGDFIAYGDTFFWETTDGTHMLFEVDY